MARPKSQSGGVQEQAEGRTTDIPSRTANEVGSTARRDVMSVAQRSALMSRIRGRDTGPERRMREILQELGIDFVEQDRSLPGRPDFVMQDLRIVVLVDGDFWHGWNFNEWKQKLAPRWKNKISSNIRRDKKNRKALRNDGWTVIRVWEHQLKRSTGQVRRRLRDNLRRSKTRRDLAENGAAARQGA